MIKNLNLLPQMIASGVITTKEGVNELASFICVNYKIFGLHKYDEDFRNDIIVEVLEKGENIFSNFKPESGDFFNYIYCFVKSKILLTLKRQAKSIVNEKFTFQEAITSYNDNCSKYNYIDTADYRSGTIPFNYHKITAEELKEGLKNCKLEEYDKGIFFLSIKAAYDLDDSQIIKIAKIYNIDLNLFYNLIQYMREFVLAKKMRLDECIERRNVKYYKHRKYLEQIEYLNSHDVSNSFLKKLILERKDSVQLTNLNKSNIKFENGFIYLRPPTRIIAEICNISERQINYYLHCLKKDKIDPELLKKIEDIN